MKIAIIADVHFGIRNDNPLFHDVHTRFFFDHFFPYLRANNIKTLVSLGDLFDRRKYINFKSLEVVTNSFIAPIIADNIDAHLIVGNHDAVFKNTLDLNAYNLLFKDKPVKIYQEPEHVIFDERKFLMVPWINVENAEDVSTMLSNSDADVCCGHFEVEGMCMVRGIMSKGGRSPSEFIKFDHTFSGHFHIPSESGSVVMVGSPVQFTWGDYGDKKRFIVYDTETGKYESVYIGTEMFYKIDYKDGITTQDLPPGVDKGTFLKVNVISKEDTKKFDKFILFLEGLQLADLEIIEPSIYSTAVQENVPQKSSLEIMHEYIESIDSLGDEQMKEELKTEITSLYQEAMSRRSTI
jgi:DNA repair exonuclease SbcCD nuclease subunit